MNPLVESVVNLSEGRDPVAIARFCDSVESVPGCYLLDVHRDGDHNRSVYTLVGEPKEILEGTYRLVVAAVNSIDLNRHQGVHPRIGAADVVPFIPLMGITIQDCIDISLKFAERLASEWEIPIYLYGLASRREDRTELSQIRRGQFEGLKAERQLAGLIQPDFGPDRVHPTAGATIVGVRQVLIAFNVFLQRAELPLLRTIARRVRERTGGLPGVRALGLQLANRRLSQISMNLVDFRRTAPLQAFCAVRRLAATTGLNVLGSEIVGLAPRAALPENPVAELSLVEPGRSCILEDRIRDVVGLDIRL
jgi:glutamate formiminotransferase